MVVANVGALRGCIPSESTRGGTDRSHDRHAGRRHAARWWRPLSEGRVRGGGEPIRPPRRLIPVLPDLVEGIRRSPLRRWLRNCPASSRHLRRWCSHPPADRASLRAPYQRAERLLSSGQLLLHQPLQPAVEVDLCGMCSSEDRNGSRPGSLQLGRPVLKAGAVLFRERRPGGELQSPPSRRRYAANDASRPGAYEAPEDDLESLALGVPMIDHGRSGRAGDLVEEPA